MLVSDDDFRGDTWFDGWWKYKLEKLGCNTEKEWYDVIQEWIFEHAIAPVAEEPREAVAATMLDDATGVYTGPCRIS